MTTRHEAPLGAAPAAGRRAKYIGILICGVVLALATIPLFRLSTPAPTAHATVAQPTARPPIPVLAYYYIWFDSQSWDRAKTDLPLLKAYSSDDRKVMQQHIQWAKQSGITGFIVSWKSTPTLNRRLAQ